MSKGKPKFEDSQRSAPKPLSPSRRRAFAAITISSPLLLFVLLETILRVFNYGGDLGLFITGPQGYEEYLRCNPNVARRYFTVQSIIPSPPKELFLKNKPSNGYRIFVLGESSAAGFPYETNGSFPNILQRSLSDAFPEKRIEVVNVSMSAINSYALLDLIDEVLAQSPDAVLIYTGHNEYYGALGVGSVQSIGNARWLVRLYLRLQWLRSFLLLRDAIGWLKVQFSNIVYSGSAVKPSATLMESIVAQQTIPYGSRLYEAGKKQFEENMEAILGKARDKGVRVVIAELVSNIRDQAPFISVRDKDDNSAASFYSRAQQAEKGGDFAAARLDYRKAKDYDALRFRAPEDFNDIVRSLARKYSCALVPTEEYFERSSPHRLVGNSLMLEHLHPNYDGYFLIAKAFYETMRANSMIETTWPRESFIDDEKGEGMTQLDSVYAALVVRHLKSGWPFRQKSLPNNFVADFRPADLVEEIAFRVLQGTDFSLEAGHMELGEYYQTNGDMKRAYSEYYALVTSIPQEMEFYRKAATILLAEKKFDDASRLLERSLTYKENTFARKWIGQIALMKNDLNGAITSLRRADPTDPQVVFNLARAYYFSGAWERGEESFILLQSLSPPEEYTTYLSRLRMLLKVKKEQG